MVYLEGWHTLESVRLPPTSGQRVACRPTQLGATSMQARTRKSAKTSAYRLTRFERVGSQDTRHPNGGQAVPSHA